MRQRQRQTEIERQRVRQRQRQTDRQTEIERERKCETEKRKRRRERERELPACSVKTSSVATVSLVIMKQLQIVKGLHSERWHYDGQRHMTPFLLLLCFFVVGCCFLTSPLLTTIKTCKPIF